MFNMDEFLKGAAGGGALQELTNIMKAGGISQPSSGDMHIDTALTNISLAFMQDAAGFVARKAFRSVPVTHRGNVFWTYPRGAFNRNEMARRAPGAESQGANYQTDTAKYYCDVFALHVDVADQVRDNADNAFSIDRDVTNFLTMKGMLLEEIDWRDKFFGGANFSATPGSVWDFVYDGAASPTAAATLDSTDAANNDVVRWSDTPGAGELGPIELMKRAKRDMQQATSFGQRNMVLVMGREVFDVLTDNPDIIDRIDRGQTPGGPALSTEQNLATLFGVDEVIVMDAIENVSEVGLVDAHQFIGGKNALLLYRPTSPGLMTPAPGYTFLWSGFSGANSGGARIKNFRMENLESDRIEIQSAFEHNQVSKELGVYFNGIIE